MTSATESGDHHKAFFVKTFSLIIFVFLFSASILTFILLVRQKQHEQGNGRIIPLIMFDGGSFKHIWGTGMQHTGLLINY